MYVESDTESPNMLLYVASNTREEGPESQIIFSVAGIILEEDLESRNICLSPRIYVTRDLNHGLLFLWTRMYVTQAGHGILILSQSLINIREEVTEQRRRGS